MKGMRMMIGLKSKKAQASSLDLFIAASIFMIIMTLTILTYSNYSKQVEDNSEYEDMFLKALELSDAFVKTAGIPTNWNKSNVIVFGFAEEDRKISKEKAQRFCSFPMNDSRKVMSLNYQFYFNLSDGNITISCGSVPTGSRAVNIPRRILLENKSAVLEFTVWK